MDHYGYLPLDVFTAADYPFLEVYMHIDLEKSRVYRKDLWAEEYRKRCAAKARDEEERRNWNEAKEIGLEVNTYKLLKGNAAASELLAQLQALADKLRNKKRGGNV